jgi:hypothetical protein
MEDDVGFFKNVGGVKKIKKINVIQQPAVR